MSAVADLLIGLAGCGGVRFQEGSYVVSQKGYRVGAPDGWTRIESEADLALRRADLSAGLIAHATCEGRPPVRPLPVLVRHLRFGLRDVRELVETPVTLGGLSGTGQRFRATLDGVPVAVRAVTVRGASTISWVWSRPTRSPRSRRTSRDSRRDSRSWERHSDGRLAARGATCADRRSLLGRSGPPHLGRRAERVAPAPVCAARRRRV